MENEKKKEGLRITWKVENPWFQVGNQQKRGEMVHSSSHIGAGELHALVEEQTGPIRVLYQIKAYQKTEPIKKTHRTAFNEDLDLKVQIKWPSSIRRYCEEHFAEIKLGSATNERCDCDRYNIANEDEVMCHTCALIKRVCCVCQKPVDVEKEEEETREKCDILDIPYPDDIFPLDFSYLHRHDQ